MCPYIRKADVRCSLFFNADVQRRGALGNAGSSGYEEHADLWFITLDKESQRKELVVYYHLHI